MNQKHRQAQPPLEFIPPMLNPWVLKGCKIILPFWLQTRTEVADIHSQGVETLVECYQQFQEKKTRFLMAFRHPNINDPYCLAYLWWRIIPQVAKQKKIPLKKPIHAHFMYDRGIPIWAGEKVGWLYSSLGGTSIQRGKMDLMGLRSARHLFTDGEFPMAASPEGATNGHNEIISPLEPGIPQLSFWCVEDLRKAKRSESVLIVPIGIQYHYLTPPWEKISYLLTQLETESGLISHQEESVNEKMLYQRLYTLAEHFLKIIEEFYRDFYHKKIPQIEPQNIDNPNLALGIRLQNLLNTALSVSEEYFNLEPTGNVIDRCRRIEQAGWDYIYRQELKPTHPLSIVERGLANRVAEEAELMMWHMRIVESFVAVTGYYVKEKLTAERFAETSLLLWDLVARIKGESSFFRPQLGKQTVQITIGEPISVSDRSLDYQKNRRQAVANLTQDLQTALDSLIIRD
ncbi:glycerol acyltransferase [Aphanothece hegewaldii CCALA 016]|uniref:Glycerol acyltransferase n=1 Tax=Aphanothece hegewaldii CCALA 016 TaxID=2107694 RepID=A0A2T1LZ21_9CHRO|nr:glycerol acyltransferase [Aphanothece hegewaldii]PSF37654.1 glycerol acyltransferase [Aphanothece hegewaldii CCALA 016]